MRSWFSAFVLGALVFALAEQAAVPNFAGTWTLDKSRSQDLAPRYKSFQRISWNITQTDKEISIKEAFIDFAFKDLPPARPGTGGGIGTEPIGARTYNFDGSETIKNIGRSKFARKAIVSIDGKTLELVEKITHQGIDGEVTTTDKLSLSADGKVLTVIRSKDGTPGPKDSTLVFNK